MAIDFDGDYKLPRTYTESDLKLERAAALRLAAKTICVNCSDGLPIKQGDFIMHTLFIDGKDHTAHCYAHAILALIPSDSASALDKLLAEERLKGSFDVLAQIHSFRKQHPMDIGMQVTINFIGTLYRQYEDALRAAPRDSGKAAAQPTGTPEERER